MSTQKRKVHCKINSIDVSVPSGTTILEVADGLGIKIPTICYLKGIQPLATCRVCQVEDASRGVLIAACSTPVSDGMDIRTESEKVKQARKTIIELMLASHPDICLVCDRHGTCLLRKVAAAEEIGRISVEKISLPVQFEATSEFIVRDMQKCILCGRCVKVCRDFIVQGTIDYYKRGFNTTIAKVGGGPLSSPDCIHCAVCIAVCPTGALDYKISFKGQQKSAASSRVVICEGCGCGCKIELRVADNKIVKRLPYADEGNIPVGCHRGVEYGDESKGRKILLEPLVRREENLVPSNWDEAVSKATDELSRIISTYGPGSLGAWISPLSSCEEGYYLQKFLAGELKCKNLEVAGSGLLRDHILLRPSGSGVGYPSLCSLDDIVRSDLVVAIGSGISREAPAVDFAIRRGVRAGNTKLILIDEGGETPLSRWSFIRVSSKEEMVSLILASIGKTILSITSQVEDGERRSYPEIPVYEKMTLQEKRAIASAEHKRLIEEISLVGVNGEDIVRAAEEILFSRRLVIVLGFSGDGFRPCADCEEAAFLAQVSWHPARESAGIIPAGAFMNEVGLIRSRFSPYFSNRIPGKSSIHSTVKNHQLEKNISKDADSSCGLSGVTDEKWEGIIEGSGIAMSLEMIRSGKIKGLILFGHDSLNFAAKRIYGKEDLPALMAGLQQLEFLLVLDSHYGAWIDKANVVLPICQHEARSGTFVGIDGIARRSQAAVQAEGSCISGEEAILRLKKAFKLDFEG